MYYLCSENKGTDQLRVTVKLICVFVFAYAKSLFSHDKAHMKLIRLDKKMRSLHFLHVVWSCLINVILKDINCKCC